MPRGPDLVRTPGLRCKGYYFETGHMVYIDRKAQARLKNDVDELIRANANVQ